jgi:hypothetical protein
MIAMRCAMRREVALFYIGVAVCGAAVACRQSADDRAHHAAARAREQAAVRETPTVQRVTIPRESGRILYDPPPDLSASTPGRVGVAINGVDTSSRKADSALATPRKASPAT